MLVSIRNLLFHFWSLETDSGVSTHWGCPSGLHTTSFCYILMCWENSKTPFVPLLGAPTLFTWGLDVWRFKGEDHGNTQVGAAVTQMRNEPHCRVDLPRETPDNYRHTSVPSCFEVHWTWYSTHVLILFGQYCTYLYAKICVDCLLTC